MRGNLFPTTVYLDQETRKQVERLSLTTGKPKAAIVREALTTGLKTYQPTPSKSVKALLDLAEWAEKEGITGKVTDASTNHNKYAWEEWEG